MKLVIIFGPQAVGKMSVGHELSQITPLKLFHNHISLELFHPYFGFGPETRRLSDIVRNEFFKAFAASEQYGLIFTFVWAFDLQSDWEYIDKLKQLFEENGAEIYFVELEASLDIRLARNKSAFRLEQKPSKNNITKSEKDIIDTMNKHRVNSYPNELSFKHYIKINNSELPPQAVAQMIQKNSIYSK